MPEHPKRPRDLNQWAKHMVDLATGNATVGGPDPTKDAAAQSLGRATLCVDHSITSEGASGVFNKGKARCLTPVHKHASRSGRRGSRCILCRTHLAARTPVERNVARSLTRRALIDILCPRRLAEAGRSSDSGDKERN